MSDTMTDDQLRKMSGWDTKPTCLQGLADELLAARTQLAAKDREIAALMKERDMWKGSSCAMEGLVRENDDTIAALREAEVELLACSFLMDDDGPGCPTTRLLDARECVRAALTPPQPQPASTAETQSDPSALIHS